MTEHDLKAIDMIHRYEAGETNQSENNLMNRIAYDMGFDLEDVLHTGWFEIRLAEALRDD